MTVSTPEPQASSPPRRQAQSRGPRVPRAVGAGAGLFAVSVLIYGVVGALWGLWRPAYSGTVTDDGGFAVAGGGNVAFTGYITFAVITGLMSAVMAILMFQASPATRGAPMLWWVGVVAFIAAVAFLVVGDLVAAARHPMPEDVDAITPDATFSVAPVFQPGVAWLVAPFMAVLAYWFSALTAVPEPEPYLPAQRM
ncbi:hypothetical protein [Corynebacterium maris]|uniref:hypothetical protein n=1 Tax=Corynebacterium maris TaxID=575200 RepID=UPI0012ECB02F|nr:hypothetical protein [Corynebacterium maris]